MNRQATAQVSPIPPQAVGRVAFDIIPDWLDRVEFGGIRRELFHMPPGVGLLSRRDGWSLVD